MINIKVIRSSGVLVDSEIERAIIPGVDGDFEVLDNHTSFMTKIRPGILLLYKNNNEEEKYAIHSGFVTVDNNNISIVSDLMETISEINKDRAEESKKRAENRLSSNDKNIDYRRVEISLKKALIRLSLAK